MFRRQILLLPLLAIVLVALTPSNSSAQLSIGAPSSLKVRSCDEFATNELNNPMDMSDSADINNFFEGIDVNSVTNVGFSNGLFSATTATNGSLLYLFSPKPCGAYEIGGRWGQNLNINTAKYTRLSMRMYTGAVDPFGVRLLWDRSGNYANDRTITTAASFPTRLGWKTYSVDLNSMGIDPSTDPRPWSAGSITGFAILPHSQPGSSVKFDWIRIEDPTTCSGLGVNIPYTAVTQGNNNRFSLYLDDDTNPYNGYVRKLVSDQAAAGASSTPVNDVIGIFPSQYNIVGILDSDFATLERENPWDMNDVEDVSTFGNISGATFSNGVLSGQAGGGGGVVYLQVGAGIPTGTFSKLSIKTTFSGANFGVNWLGGGTNVGAGNHIGGNVYQVNLAGIGSWSGTTTLLALTFSPGPFTLDFASLRSMGFEVSRDATALAGSVVTSASTFTVNKPPQISIDTPNSKGGEGIRPWNMRPGDVAVYDGLTASEDPAHPGEAKSTYLPDVRYVSGVRGDFFKGANADGNADPSLYLTFPTVAHPIAFNAEEYRNLCFRVFVDHGFDLGLGSVGRVVWKPAGGNFDISDDLPLIYDGWSTSRFYEYCADMKAVPSDATGLPNWNGTMEAFRFDPHEFTPETQFYVDWVKLKKDHQAPGQFNIVYSVSDPDDTATVDFYYSPTRSALGTHIAAVSEGENSRVYAWNTAAVPPGTYYIHAVASDGYNSTTRFGAGRVTVSNASVPGAAPVLSLQAPSEGLAVCDSLQVKGYSLQPDRFEDVATVEVLVDNQLFTTVHPSIYSPSAVVDYPLMDSSNSGFNGLFDTSAIADGAHTVTVTAYSSHGPSTSITRNIVRQRVGCPDPIADAEPSGSPVGIVPPGPTPGVIVSSVKHTATGAFSITLKGISKIDAGCNIQLFGGVAANAVTSGFKTVPIVSKDISKKSITLSLKRLQVATKGPAKLYVKAQAICGGVTYDASKAKSGKLFKTTKGVKTAAKLIKSISKVKKVTPPKKKKK